MRDRKLRWDERLQIEVGVSWKMVPSGQGMTWRNWAFDPSFGVTWPGQEITSRWQLPEASSTYVDTLCVGEGTGNKYVSLAFWVHGALRVLGLDIGFGVFWRKQTPCQA